MTLVTERAGNLSIDEDSQVGLLTRRFVGLSTEQTPKQSIEIEAKWSDDFELVITGPEFTSTMQKPETTSHDSRKVRFGAAKRKDTSPDH